jgi:hypothetical protein
MSKTNQTNHNAWEGAAVAIIALTITRSVLDSIGGVKALPITVQIIMVTTLLALLIWLINKEKNKCSKNKIKCKVFMHFCILFAGLGVSICFLIIVYNLFPRLWHEIRSAFIAIFLIYFCGYSLYIIIMVIKNIDKIRRA